MRFVPAEVDIWGVYVPPMLVNATLGALAMLVTVYLLNRFRISRFFNFPEVVMLCLAVIYTVIFNTFLFPS